jgi:hypothetical protein
LPRLNPRYSVMACAGMGASSTFICSQELFNAAPSRGFWQFSLKAAQNLKLWLRLSSRFNCLARCYSNYESLFLDFHVAVLWLFAIFYKQSHLLVSSFVSSCIAECWPWKYPDTLVIVYLVITHNSNNKQVDNTFLMYSERIARPSVRNRMTKWKNTMYYLIEIRICMLYLPPCLRFYCYLFMS